MSNILAFNKKLHLARSELKIFMECIELKSDFIESRVIVFGNAYGAPAPYGR